MRPVSLFSLTEVEHGKLRAEDKREKMTLRNVDAYNAVLGDSQLLFPAGPMHLIDIHRLTQGLRSLLLSLALIAKKISRLVRGPALH